jgi:O-acetyl-ADP-ribose deacetylase (regulator of RNase III)
MAPRIGLLEGDLTRQHVDAIVNAANSSLLGGGGVDGAIHRAGGPAILAECRELRRTRFPDGLPTGDAVATSGGNLPARWVIHTVGPVWDGGERGEARLLANCYRHSLALAAQHNLRSIAFPAISTGIYGYPPDRAARIAVRTVQAALPEFPAIERVIFCCFGADSRQHHEEALAMLADKRA